MSAVTWPVPDEIDDAMLGRRLFAHPVAAVVERDAIDWAQLQQELKRCGVTLMLLWHEYRGRNPQGYSYSRFCELYGEWRRKISATMRQTHVAGDKLFVDFAGDTIAIVDPLTGQSQPAHVFVAALGASNYTYAEARGSEGLADWIGSHVNALTALGGVPKAVVCDNLKAGVTKPSRYEPGINRTYQDLANHYGFAVLPTRVKKPRDKAKVEVAVLTDADVAEFCSDLLAVAVMETELPAVQVVRDAGDDMILACALAARADYLDLA
jgi:transposase